jgi:hypothetical protein
VRGICGNCRADHRNAHSKKFGGETCIKKIDQPVARALPRREISAPSATKKFRLSGMLGRLPCSLVCRVKNRLLGDFWGFMREAQQTARQNSQNWSYNFYPILFRRNK